ncbi:MAG: hypothetical protein ACKOC5_09850 [Chloroflexota bacterium]
MSEQQPNEQQPNNEESLRREFESLGRNLVDAMRTAWDAPESKRMRDDVVSGLADLGLTLKREAENLANSQAAHQVKTSVEQVGERLRTPEVQAKVRGELLDALQTVNTELQKVINRWSAPADAAPADAAPADGAPVDGAPADAAPVVPPPDEPPAPGGEPA